MITLFENIGQLVTCDTRDDSCVLSNATLAIEDGVIRAIGAFAGQANEHIDCRGQVVTPGLIDSHTHAVFGGWRSAEYELRSRGVGYMEIARQGGGINSSVRDVRSRTEDELVELTRSRLAEFPRFGITTVEVKSGYGLETSAELKQLRAARRAAEHSVVDVLTTFLGAHEFPPEYRERRADYVALIVQEMIPAVAAEGLATFCDVFMEPGVFDEKQTRMVLEAGRQHGLLPKLHADELENSGAAELAAQLGAVSADHLGAISERGIAALAASHTVATLLPGTLFFLGKKKYAPARALIEAGVTVALATDYNPGTSPSANLPLTMTFACSQMGMTPFEALWAATAGGAAALALRDGRGTVREGAPADLVIWDARDYREIPYHYGSPRITAVYKRGEQVFPSVSST